MFPQSQDASNICHVTSILLLKVSINKTKTQKTNDLFILVSNLFYRIWVTLFTICEGLYLSGLRTHEIQDVVPAADVQLAALQPMALVRPGPDVFAAAGVQLNHR